MGQAGGTGDENPKPTTPSPPLTVLPNLPNLPNLTAVFEFLYKFFDKVAIFGPACGGVQAIALSLDWSG